MKQRKTILLTGVLILGIGIFLIIKLANFYYLREQANPNSIIVEVDEGVSIDDIMIKWSSYGNTSTLFENGEDQKVKFKQYGNNIFSLYHKRILIAEFHQFKFNNWHGHSYTFNLCVENELIIANWHVSGPDAERAYKINQQITTSPQIQGMHCQF